MLDIQAEPNGLPITAPTPGQGRQEVPGMMTSTVPAGCSLPLRLRAYA